MPTPERLAAAVRAGIITDEQAERIAALDMAAPDATARDDRALPGAVSSPFAQALADADNETVHFARGFQDIFLTIGLVLLLVGAGIAGPQLLGMVGGTFAAAALAFLLAVYFAGSRMLVLPSIALALGFSLFVGVGVGAVLGGEGWSALFPRYGGAMSALSLLGGGAAAGVAAAVFFALYRLPFALAIIAVSMIYVIFGGLSLSLGPDEFAHNTMEALLALGLVTFVVAMAFDLGDPLRRTLRADNAFWLHLVAAPMIVHSLIALLISTDRSDFSSLQSVAVIGLVVMFGVVALVIDRRALLVAGLSYLAFAIYRLLADAQIEGSGLLAATLVFVGATVVLLGAGWRPIRAALLRFVPANARRHLPPVILA